MAGYDEAILGAALAAASKEDLTMAVCTHLDQIKLHRASRSRRGLRGVPEDRRLVGPPAHV